MTDTTADTLPSLEHAPLTAEERERLESVARQLWAELDARREVTPSPPGR